MMRIPISLYYDTGVADTTVCLIVLKMFPHFSLLCRIPMCPGQGNELHLVYTGICNFILLPFTGFVTIIQMGMSARKFQGKILLFLRYKNVFNRSEAVILLLYVDQPKNENPTTWRWQDSDWKIYGFYMTLLNWRINHMSTYFRFLLYELMKKAFFLKPLQTGNLLLAIKSILVNKTYYHQTLLSKN